MVSIIITTYNYDRYVERAIRSALNQSLPKNAFEVIVVNDCSTDNTIEVLKNYENELRIYHLEMNVGLSAARNFGIKKAKGQFVVFLDADDYIHSDLVYIQKMFLELNNTIDAVSCDYFLVNDKEIHLEHVCANEKPIACGIMFRKDYLYEIGLYDESFKAREEEDLRIRFAQKYSITRIPLPLYRYRRHGENLTNNHEKMNEFADKLAKKHQ
jgi:glycosyltransferase involved in cell wall biosynthesis